MIGGWVVRVFDEKEVENVPMRTEWATRDRAEEYKVEIESDSPGFFAVVGTDDPEGAEVESSYEYLGLLRNVFAGRS